MPEALSVDTLIHARYVIPVRPNNTVLSNHCVAIKDDAIVEVLASEDARTKYSATQSFELSQHAIMPGLINAHGHTPMSLFRGIADDLPLMEWLNDHIWPAEGKWVSEEFVRDGTELAIAEMIRGGTTCFSDMYFFPNISAQVAEEYGMRTQLCCPVLDFPTVWASGPEEYIEKALNLAVEYADSDLVDIGFGPHAPYTVSDAPLENIRDLAIEHDIPVQIHLHETQFEVDEALKNTSIRPIERLRNIGLISEKLSLQCVHMTALNSEDIATLATNNIHVVHCPESNLKLASGFCPSAELINNSVNIALGTDGAASNNDLDMFGEMRTAALLAKGVAQDASVVNATQAIEMATLNGAKALGIDDITGSIEPGKAADLIAIDLAELNSQPSYDPISDIVYSVASNQVSHSWINGSLLLDEGKLLRMNKDDIIKKAKHWADKISTK
jgi:5-methylthioadenosine/S-adenosylhomocysteine deaminase